MNEFKLFLVFCFVFGVSFGLRMRAAHGEARAAKAPFVNWFVVFQLISAGTLLSERQVWVSYS